MVLFFVAALFLIRCLHACCAMCKGRRVCVASWHRAPFLADLLQALHTTQQPWSAGPQHLRRKPDDSPLPQPRAAMRPRSGRYNTAPAAVTAAAAGPQGTEARAPTLDLLSSSSSRYLILASWKRAACAQGHVHMGAHTSWVYACHKSHTGQAEHAPCSCTLNILALYFLSPARSCGPG